MHKDFRIHNLATAEKLVNHFQPEERALLLKILSKKCRTTKDCPLNKDGSVINGKQSLKKKIFNFILDRIKFSQLKQVFIINTMPFIGFGILDNMIMLLAGEYIDQVYFF